MPRSNYGHSLVDGKIQYFSASSLTLGDPDSSDGCLRKWWYEKVKGLRPPSTKAQEAGTQLHAEIENYLRTGDAVLGPLAARGKPLIPEPGPDLLIEHDIMISPRDEMVARDAEIEGRTEVAERIRSASLSNAPLRILGVPVVGYIDLVHSRCTNKGVSDIEDIHDPPGTIEVIDWKTTSNANYIKSPVEISRTIQMTVYGKWVTETLPGTSHVRLSHGYFVTRGSDPPRKVTKRLIPEQIDRQWERVERVAGSIIDAARETDVDKVPANTRACDAYGGCPHRSYCRAGMQETLVDFFGATGADHMLRRLNNVNSTSVNIAARQPPRSLLGIDAKKKEEPLSEELKAEMIRLGREEIEVKYPGLPATWDALEACKAGNPFYSGELAKAISVLMGLHPTTEVISGSGDLAAFGPFSDPADLAALLEEVKQFVSSANDEERVHHEPANDIVALLPPEAPPSEPSLASEAPEPETPASTPAKRGRGRPKKAAQSPMIMQVPGEVPEGVTLEKGLVTPILQDVDSLGKSDKIYFYVNCAPSIPFESFWPRVHELMDDLNTASQPSLDFRLVPNEHKFAYGRWKAAIAAALNSMQLPPGHYVLSGVGGEVGMAIVEAMRAVVCSRGGVFVQ